MSLYLPNNILLSRFFNVVSGRLCQLQAYFLVVDIFNLIPYGCPPVVLALLPRFSNQIIGRKGERGNILMVCI